MPVYLPSLTFGGLGYGGSSYGFSPYGSGVFPRLSVPVDGGYGGQQYGYESYGSIDIIPPKVTGANSLDGFRVEILFSEEMLNSGVLVNPANYVFTDVFGVPLTSLSVGGGTPGTQGGFTSVIVTHTGSTLGGQYQVVVTNVADLAGNVISNSPATFSAFGDVPSVAASFPVPDDGRTVRLTFQDSRSQPQDLLTEVQFSPGVDDTSSYDLSTTYPVPPVLSNPIQNPAVLSQVDLDVHPMTSALYDLIVGPSLSYDYLGSVLPSADPQLTGVESGTGTSVPSGIDGLLMSKVMPDTYGWAFLDTSGRVLPDTTYRVDFKVDASAATIVPVVFGSTLATLSVTDGAIEVNLNLEDVAGSKVIGIVSGALTASVPAAWDSGEVTVTLVRNQQAGFYTLLLDGVPLFTTSIASATGAPTFSAGARVTLGSAHDVTLFKLKEVAFTASLTLFTSAWNFIHGVPAPFTGSPALSRDTLFTKRGPLVRGWGDATPALKEDVEVRVNGTVVDLAGVNPYVGEVYPTIPIPLSTPGTVSVVVDYIWFTNPVFELAGLNTRGLALNVWDRRIGMGMGGVSPTPDTATGTLAENRFPMGIVIGPMARPSPVAIGHRYIGLQKNYSALLNEPTTLLLNQNPHRVSVGELTASAMLEQGLFNGQTTPQNAASNWALDGVDAGAVVGDGTYRVIDASSGPYGLGTATVYRRSLDLSLSTFVSESGRFQVEDYTLDGVFTGVAFGVHDGHNLILVGALIIDGVRHLGVLLDGEIPHLEAGWQVGPSADATASSQGTLVLDSGSLPPGVSSGSRFRIAVGSQSGVYTIEGCGLQSIKEGTQVEVTFAPALPVDITGFGNDTFVLFFETPWDESLVSLRIQAQFPEPGSSAQVFLGGQVSGLVADLATLPAFPAQTALLLPAIKGGVAFFGSLSRRAGNQTVWDLVQYVSSPERLTQTSQGLTAQTEMNVLPQDDPNDPWFIVGDFGYAAVDAGGDHTLIKTTSASDDSTIDLEYSYQRVEPFLSNRVTCDTEANFQVESGRLGAGDVSIVVRDGEREVQFTNLLYTTSAASRSLVTDLPQVSLSGLQDPASGGWTKEASNTIGNPFVRGQTLEFSKTSGSTGRWAKLLAAPNTVSYEGLIAEARVSVETFSVGSLGVGFFFGCRVPVVPGFIRQVNVGLSAGSVFFFDSSGTAVGSFPYAWDDGEEHTYRITCDPTANIVVLVVDDTVVGSVAFASFPAASGEARGDVGGLGTGAANFVLDSFSVTPLRPLALTGSALGRTFGILVRDGEGSPDDINSWRIPRSDGTGAPNTSPAAVPVTMDWRTYAHVRLLLDPTWGVSFYRPDLPLPPGYTGDFVTASTDPTAAWAVVEYAELPVVKAPRGCVAFGSPDPRAVSQSRWDFMRYRIRGDVDGFGIAPQGMVLNRYFTFTSGEFLVDVTPEVKTITSRTSTLLRIDDSAVFADRVFVVQVDGAVLASANWAFDKESQNLLFGTPLPGEQYPVTVTFAPGNPITKEYLCTQPFTGSVTVLNEGTPPVPASRDLAATVEVVFGSQLNDPNDVLDDAESLILNDPYRFVKFSDDENSLYASTEFCEVTDGESVHLSTLCDGPGPGEGLAEIGLVGEFAHDRVEGIPEGPAGPFGGQSPVIKGSAAHFPQTSVLYASGGSFVDGVLGPGTAIMWPNGRGPTWDPLPAGARMGMNQDVLMGLQDTTPREDLFELASLMGDNVPASSADPDTDPNPDGVPGTFLGGAAAYQLEDTSLSPYSRLGPYGGLVVLGVRSLLGGGNPLDGTEFILGGGAPLPVIITVTTGVMEAAN